MSELHQVGIIGAGVMGHALAVVHALGGMDVKLTDNSSKVLSDAPTLMRSALDTMIEAGAISSTKAQQALARIVTVETLEACVGDVDLIVEAIVEKPELKKQLFEQLAAIADKNAIIASNTSYLDIFKVTPEFLQQRTLVAHWYTPPYIIDLVDVAVGPSTLPHYRDRIVDLYRGFGKEVVTFDSLVPGYIANRLQSAMTLEAFRLLDEGLATSEDIDKSIRHGLALRLTLLGHLKKADFTGLEMVNNALANQMYHPPAVTGSSTTLDSLLEAGKTGVGAGAGFYDYGGEQPAQLYRTRDIKLLQLKRAVKDVGEM